MDNKLKTEIQKFFKGEALDDDMTLMKYSRDASLLEVRPKMVLYPKDSEDIQNLVKWVNENKKYKEKYGELSITARCAGTDMSGGAIGESIILDFTKYMNKLVGGPLPLDDHLVLGVPSGTPSTKVNAKPKNINSKFRNYPLIPSYITVEPGMLYRNFEKLTFAKGLLLPCYTASKSINAMGGMFGNNSAGERTLKYGKTEDYILESKVVFSDGNEYVVKPLSKKELEKKIAQKDFEGKIYRDIYKLIKDNESEIRHGKPNVRKNSAGYYIWNVINNDSKISDDSSYFDLNKILVGSQGTLGIVTEITFKVIPIHRYSKLVAVFVNNLEPLGRLVSEILGFDPETLEAYDDKTIKLAVKFFPDFLKQRGFFSTMKFAWNFLPEFMMFLRGGFPKLILLVEFAGTDEASVHSQCLKLAEGIKNFDVKIYITKNRTEADKYWDIRRESFSLLRKHVRGMHTAPFIDDIIVRPEFLPKFLPELNKILKKYDLKYTLTGHAGDGNFHIIPLMDFKRSDVARVITELSDLVYDLVLRYRGSITAEHNDGLIRTPYLHKMYGDGMMSIFTEIKNIFDSKNFFNPGKKIATESLGGTKEYIKMHIAREHRSIHRV